MTGRALPVQCLTAKSALTTLVAFLLGSELVENILDKIDIHTCDGRILRYLQIDQFLQAWDEWLLAQPLGDESLRSRLSVARPDQFRQGQQRAHSWFPTRDIAQIEMELWFFVQFPEGRCDLINYFIQIFGVLLFYFLPGANGIAVIPLHRGDTAGKNTGANTPGIYRKGIQGA
jgi:hypothetical protein